MLEWCHKELLRNFKQLLNTRPPLPAMSAVRSSSLHRLRSASLIADHSTNPQNARLMTTLHSVAVFRPLTPFRTDIILAERKNL